VRIGHATTPVLDTVLTRTGEPTGLTLELPPAAATVWVQVDNDDKSGSAHWEARYTFSQTGRRVVNVISAEFEFEAGRIIRHRDSFPLWRWSSQALGPVGMLLGWAPPLQGKIRAQSARTLEAFIAKNGLG
jgi:hypothetical protein